jgi:hypothetical protein
MMSKMRRPVASTPRLNKHRLDLPRGKLVLTRRAIDALGQRPS